MEITKECDLLALISGELNVEIKPSRCLIPQLSANEAITHPFKIDLSKSYGLDDKENLNLVILAALYPLLSLNFERFSPG